MTILDYKLCDLMFAYWLKRKREMLGERNPVGTWGRWPLDCLIDAELDRLRPLRNPNCTSFVLDKGPLYAA